VYLPFVDERGAGMQRFGQEMIAALERAGVDFELLIGERLGDVAWLDARPHRLLLSPALSARLPRAAAALLRLARVQRALSRPGRTVVALAHEVAARPRGRQIAVVHDITWLKPFAPARNQGTIVRDALWCAGLKRSRVIAISDATRRDVAQWAGIDAHAIPVVYEGFDPRLFHPDHQGGLQGVARAGRPVLLYAGTLATHKNVACILSAFVGVRERGVDAVLKLVGRYEPSQAAVLLASVPEPWRADIDFAGFVSTEQLGDEMRACAAFLFPSRNEGFGLAPVEAMACGAPVLSSPGGSLAEVVADGGWLLDPDDPGAWADAIARVLCDADLAADLRARALTRAQLFSWDRAADQYRVIMETDRAAR
jgi:glycosyltransferase involved in cell wall biosynthesis